uniref:Peptidase S8/S53 domain-containing protein n=1 Tax=Timema monikensis TaxID=170555 RepID=A0A7R9HMT4_9NEOP|nr:unnamed protein product [Timema monikensis]
MQMDMTDDESDTTGSRYSTSDVDDMIQNWDGDNYTCKAKMLPSGRMTSDGRKKVVERYDCSGAGDVDTSIVVQANNDGNIVGVSGRLLKIPTDWTNPSGQFHIGIVNCYDLYPAKLRERIEKYRKEKLWDPGFKKAFADTMRKLQFFQCGRNNLFYIIIFVAIIFSQTWRPSQRGGGSDDPNSMDVAQTVDLTTQAPWMSLLFVTDDTEFPSSMLGVVEWVCKIKRRKDKGKVKGKQKRAKILRGEVKVRFVDTPLGSSGRRGLEVESILDFLACMNKFTKEDLEIRMELLSSLEKKYCDPGPAFDCVIFHDGICWRACLDTSECGDMTSCKLLGEYSVTHDYAAISTVDQFNYSINVHNDGNTLEVVGMCFLTSHGTHVASIAAAYFEDSPEKNGIAPGAQIVSFTIGDNRLNSMETGTSLVRAMIQVMQRQNDPETRIHIINMSYGEHTHFSSSGRIGELMAEVIDKHGLIWVASAGNNGPALCTIGTPPDICTNNVIGYPL